MKKIGIVGGVGWLSTAEYYAGLCRRSERWHLARNPQAGSSTPEMSMESLDVRTAISLLGTDDNEESWSQYDEYHRAALKRLEISGADFLLMASNTPHHRFRSIVRGIRIPVLSILDVAAEESARIGATEVLILGTGMTMRSAPFREGFRKYGVRVIGPHDEAVRAMTVGLIGELQLGKPQGAAEQVGKIVMLSCGRLFQMQPVVCLACTELPLAFPDHNTQAVFEYDGVRYLNTTVAHINAAFDFAAHDGS